jgi:Methylamine utilisation protein MauE
MPHSQTVKQWTIFAVTWGLGIVFMAAAFLKALDVNAFTQQIARYQLLPANLELPFAIALIVVEGIVGIACLVSFRLLAALALMIALLTLFLGATLYRWSLLQDTNCNCFGPVVTGGPRAVILHTTVLIALAAVVLAVMKKTVLTSSFRAGRIAAGVFAMFLLIFVAQPFFRNNALFQNALAGDQTRIFLSAICEKCKQEAGKVRALANSTDVPPVRVFIGASFDYQINDYFKEVNLQVPYTPMTFPQLARETPHVPKVQIFRAGSLVKEWDGDVPGPDEVRQALSTAR